MKFVPSNVRFADDVIVFPAAAISNLFAVSTLLNVHVPELTLTTPDDPLESALVPPYNVPIFVPFHVPIVIVPVTSNLNNAALLAALIKFKKSPVGEVSVARLATITSTPLAVGSNWIVPAFACGAVL